MSVPTYAQPTRRTARNASRATTHRPRRAALRRTPTPSAASTNAPAAGPLPCPRRSAPGPRASRASCYSTATHAAGVATLTDALATGAAYALAGRCPLRVDVRVLDVDAPDAAAAREASTGPSRGSPSAASPTPSCTPAEARAAVTS